MPKGTGRPYDKNTKKIQKSGIKVNKLEDAKRKFRETKAKYGTTRGNKVKGK